MFYVTTCYSPDRIIILNSFIILRSLDLLGGATQDRTNAELVDLIIRGKEVLAQQDVIKNLWSHFGQELFINILKNGIYSNEDKLLDILKQWGIKKPAYLITQKNVEIHVGVFPTHKAYVRGTKGYREFGDITFVTSFSSGGKKRVAYANAFQIKVDDSPIDAYGDLFGHHLRQMNFYRKNLVASLGGPHDLNCDFIYYWLIGRTTPHKIKEIPLSFTWLGKSPPFQWPKYPLRYYDTMLRCLLLVSGIKVDYMLNFCTRGLKEKLESILRYGVSKSLEIERNKKPYKEPEKPQEEFERPDIPLISSTLVIATELVEKASESFR